MPSVRKLVRGLAGMVLPAHRSYSQFGEDTFVTAFFSGQDRGTWLDIGAFHPRVASNTNALRKRGWRGVNVDADADKIRLFRWFRRHDVNVCAAVAGPGGGTAVLDRVGSKGSYGSMDKLRFGSGPGALPTRTVDDVLDEAGFDHVDLVSIDVEGLEPAILEGFPFERVGAELFCIEILVPSLAEIEASPVTKLLAEAGYQIVGWHPPSVFFAREPRPPEGA
jgi:FkbM family methyltransferase